MLTRAPTLAACPNVKSNHLSNGPALRAPSAFQAKAHEAQGFGKRVNYSKPCSFRLTERGKTLELILLQDLTRASCLHGESRLY